MQEIIDRLRNFPAQFEALVTPLTEAQLDKRIPGEWSIRQIVHHVADSHMNAVFRFKRPLTEDRPPMPVYDQDAIAVLADYALPLAPTLQILHGLHARFAALLESLTEEQWQRTAVHPEWGEVTVAEVARRYADHGDNHIQQIKNTLAYQPETV
jgi:hypothetical protein